MNVVVSWRESEYPKSECLGMRTAVAVARSSDSTALLYVWMEKCSKPDSEEGRSADDERMGGMRADRSCSRSCFSSFLA